MRTVKLFVSSPTDVARERERVQWVADRLSGEFNGRVEFKTIRWETTVYSAHGGGYQEQIDSLATPADCDIVLTIFWARLGSPLPDNFPRRMPDGRPYASGTAYEVLSALEERKANGHHPDVFVFRKKAAYSVPDGDPTARDDADGQWNRLEEFFSQHFELPDKRVLRVAEKFNTVEQFEDKVERLLRDWIKSNVSQGVVWPIELKGSPFRGLEPFEARHADIYCGRDRKVMRALDELRSAARRGKPFLLIPGASGVGKSSLMRAGIVPRLVRPGAVEGVDFWRTAVMRPGAIDGNPMLALARSLFVTGSTTEDDPGGFGKSLPELADGPVKTAEELSQLFAGAVDIACDSIVAALNDVGQRETLQRNFERPLQANLLLLVDQLEDIFADSLTPDDRGQFANLLAALVSTQRVWIISTLRGDMYEKMISERPFISLKDIGGQYDLGPPGPDELDEIVHRSAEVAGLEYEGAQEQGANRSERLDDRLLRDAAGENTLPLLQFALNLLFERCWGVHNSKLLTHAVYEEIGGLDGAIDQTAETALTQLVRPDLKTVEFPLDRDIQDDIAKSINPSLEILLRKLVTPVDGGQSGVVAERALTARLVPISKEMRNDATGKLVEALLKARILLITRTDGGACVRIAHDRVITSWIRARTITETNREFYRVKEFIEHHQQRWQESDGSVEYLIPPGAAITQAEEMVARYADEFSEATHSFVAVASRRARFRQRLMTAATLVFAVVAVVATAASIYASVQREKAIATFQASRDTIRGLVRNIADNFKDLDGINVNTTAAALDQITSAITELERRNGSSDPELQRINATAHYEFAKAFQNTRHLPEALKEAEIGRQIRSQLATLPSPAPELLMEYTESLDQLGDIHRAMAQDQGGNAGQFAAAQKLFDESHAMRLRQFHDDRDNPIWAFGLSQSLVRIGDQKVNPGNDRAGAKTDYRQALSLIVDVFRRDPNSNDWKRERELSWCLNKVGDILLEDKKVEEAFDMYQKGLCTRRHLAYIYPTNTLLKRDLAFSLMRISETRIRNGELGAAEQSLFEALAIRQELTARDSYQTLWLSEVGDSQHRIGLFMQKANQLKLAAGFFGLAVETRDKIEQLLSTDEATNDAAATKYLKAARTKLEDSEKEFDKVAQLLSVPEHEDVERKDRAEPFIKQAKAKEKEVKAQSQLHRSDPEICWNELKASLLQTPLVEE